MTFICDEHGEVFPSEIWYSFPSTAKCPICGKEIMDKEKSMDAMVGTTSLYDLFVLKDKIEWAVGYLNKLLNRDGGPLWIRAREMVKPDILLTISELQKYDKRRNADV